MMRGARESQGLTQAELAARLEISQSEISRLEKGEGVNGPTFERIKVCRALLAARDLAALARRTRSTTIARLAGDLEADAKAVPSEFNATDYWMLLVGFACGALASLIKLFYVIPASHFGG